MPAQSLEQAREQQGHDRNGHRDVTRTIGADATEEHEEGSERQDGAEHGKVGKGEQVAR